MATQNYFKAKNGLEAPSQSTIAVTDSNFPTVRPTLNLDFAGSEVVDSRITFTRASAATYFGADGKLKYAVQNEPRIEYDPVTGECKGLLIEEQRTNLLPYSAQLGISGIWPRGAISVQSGSATPDGSMAANIVKETTDSSAYHFIQQSISKAASTLTYTFSVYAKSSNRNIGLRIQDGGGSNGAVTAYNLSTGAVITVAGLYGTSFSSPSSTITALQNGWYRISLTVTSGTETSLSAQVYMLNGTSSVYTGDGASNIQLWGAQLEQASFATSYIPSNDTFTSRASSATYFDSTGTLRIAGTNQARYGYGYDAASGKWVSQGLILESASTNNLTYYAPLPASQNANPGWFSAVSATVAYPYTLDNPSKLSDYIAQVSTTTAGDGLSIAANYTPTYSANQSFTGSIYWKNNGGNSSVRLDVVIGNTNQRRYAVTFAVAADNTVTVTNNAPSLTDYATTATQLDNGWWRFSLTGTTGSGALPSGTTWLYVLRGSTSMNAYVWGAQLEASNVPSSLMLTYGASSTRAADVSSSAATTRSIEGAAIRGSYFSNALTKTNEGTALVSATNFGSASSQYNVLHVGVDNTYGYGVFREAGTNYYWAHVRTANSSYLNLNSGRVWSAGTTSKIAFAYKSGDHALAVDGSTTSTSSVTYNDIQYVNAYNIGSADGYGGQASFNGWIQKLTHYPKRISNAQLQALTA